MKNRIKIYIFIINQNFIYIYLNYFSIMKNRIELFTILLIHMILNHNLNIYHVLYFLLIIILIIKNI